MKPVPDADTKPYWDGIEAGELRLQRCEACGAAVFYPRMICPHCFSGAMRWFTAAGTGYVYSYTVAHRAFGDFADQAPFTVALVDLDEGVRMMTRIVGADPGRVQIGMRVQMTIEPIADANLPCFRPAPFPAESGAGAERDAVASETAPEAAGASDIPPEAAEAPAETTEVPPEAAGPPPEATGPPPEAAEGAAEATEPPASEPA